jgi:hypothetical protein
MSAFTPRQAALIERYRDINVDHDWWDSEYDYVMAQMLRAGFRVGNIYFSGFWSQGDGACFDGGVKDTRQILMWVLVPGYREWYTALADSSDFPELDTYFWIHKTIKKYTATKGFIGERILEQYHQFNCQLDDMIPNLKPFMALGFDLEECGLRAEHSSSHYCHYSTIQFSSFLDGASLEQVVDELDEDDIRRFVLADLISGAEDDLEYMTERVTDYLLGEMCDLYCRLQEDYDYLTSDEAVWEAIEANDLDEEDDDV